MMLTDSLCGSSRVAIRTVSALRIFGVAAVLLLWSTSELTAATVTATWNRNPETNIETYILSYGTQPGTYSTSIDVGNVTTRQVVLNPGRYYFVVQARNTSGMTSPRSAEVVFDVGVVPSITSLSPSSGSVGTAVTINGANFGTMSGNTVRFNGTVATTSSWTATRIVASVPSLATSGAVTVTVGGVASNGMPFTVTGGSAPSITSLTPASGAVGTVVTIAGTNFGATKGTSTVTFNGTTGMPTTWSATSIVVPVPASATTGNVVVTVGGVASNTRVFTVTAPSLWTAQDVGSPALAGSASWPSGTFTVRGSGVDIWGTSDQFQFVYQTLDGDGEIVARVTSLQNTDGWAKAGVMIREDLTGGAPNAMAQVTAGNGMTFQRRVTRNGSSTSNQGFAGVAPQWVRLVRSGNTFSGYYSATGTGWVLMSSLVIAMPSRTFVGLAVTSHAPSLVTTAAFDNVIVTRAGGTIPPSITSLSPTSGGVGAAVTINGANFGATQGASTVRFNGTTATPTSWSATRIVASVPSGATTGSVTVTVGGVASNGLPFTVAGSAPNITSLSPTSGSVGTAVTINGANFGATQGASTVRFNGTTATPTSWTATRIVASVPSGATSGAVTVTVGGVASNGSPFTVAGSAPNITSLSPASGSVGTAVTINGANFGATQGASTVRFNGTTATPTSWTATRIVASVPSGATTGPVTVMVGGVASNGVTFTVSTLPSVVTLVQHRSLDGGTATSSSLAFSANNGAGNFIAVVIRAGGSGAGLTVTDSRANTYRQAARFTSGTDHTGAIYYAENIRSGANTVNVSVSAASTLRFAILEYAGVATSSALDRAVTSVGTSTSPSSGTLTTTTSGDLLLGAITINNNVNVVAGAGYTIRQSVPALPGAKMIAEDRILASAGTASAAGTLSVASPWGAALAAFKAAPAGAMATALTSQTAASPGVMSAMSEVTGGAAH